MCTLIQASGSVVFAFIELQPPWAAYDPVTSWSAVEHHNYQTSVADEKHIQLRQVHIAANHMTQVTEWAAFDMAGSFLSWMVVCELIDYFYLSLYEHVVAKNVEQQLEQHRTLRRSIWPGVKVSVLLQTQ